MGKNNDMNDATGKHHDKIRVMINNDDDNEHCTIIKKEECAADPSSNNNNMNSSAPTSSYRVDQTTTQPLTPQEQHQKENQNQIRKQQVIKTPKIVWLQRLIPRGRIDITYNDLWYALLTIGIQNLEKLISIVKYVMSWDFIIDTLLFIFGLKSFFKRGKAYSIENDNEDDEQQQRNKKKETKKRNKESLEEMIQKVWVDNHSPKIYLSNTTTTTITVEPQRFRNSYKIFDNSNK